MAVHINHLNGGFLLSGENMATREQLQQALQNPNARKMLDVIAQAEGVKNGYNTLFGNGRFDNLSQHPNISKSFRQTDGKTNSTTAAGRYQFLNRTWNNVAKRYGLNDFSPQNQDLGALALIAGRGALNDVLKGDFTSAVKKLGSEWASLPTSPYAQNKRSWDFINAATGGRSQAQPPSDPYKISASDMSKRLGKPAQVQPASDPYSISAQDMGTRLGKPAQAEPMAVQPTADPYHISADQMASRLQRG